MNSLDIPFLFIGLLIGASILLFAVGFYLGRRLSSRKSPCDTEPSTVALSARDDDDDPTAPIVPMVEMARSPHDRHRDLVIGKALVKRIDFLDAMIKSTAKKGDDNTRSQLEILRKEFFSLLGECSVEAFEYPSGTVVNSDIRSRIQIIGGNAKGDRTVIAETALCGFFYLHGDEDTMILRKAEVVIE